MSTALPLPDWRRGARALGLWRTGLSPVERDPGFSSPSWSWRALAQGGVPIRGVGAGDAGTAFFGDGCVVMCCCQRGMVEMAMGGSNGDDMVVGEKGQFSIWEDA